MASQSLSRRLPGWLILMGVLAAIGPFSVDMYLPGFPAIAAGLQVPRGDVERTLASYLVGLALTQIFYGPLADRYGRKAPMLGGLTIYTVASMGCAMASSIEMLTLCRMFQAMGSAAGIVIPRAVIRDHYETQDAARALSMLMLIMGVAPILAPLVGGQLLAVVGWRSLFWLMAAVSLAMLIATVLVMKESLAPDRVQPLRASCIARNYWALTRHRRFLAHSFAGGLGSAGMFAYIICSPRVFIEHYGLTPQYSGFLFGANAAGLIIGSQVSARLLRNHTPAHLQRVAQNALAATSLVALALVISESMTLPILMACLIGYMFSQGFVNPNSAALALSEQGMRLGAASALLGTLQMSCGAVAGAVVSVWQADGLVPLTTVLACCAVLSWLSGRIARRSVA